MLGDDHDDEEEEERGEVPGHQDEPVLRGNEDEGGDDGHDRGEEAEEEAPDHEAEEALVLAAWAGAAAMRVPQVAATRAAPARDFLGVATVRRKEAADTGGLSVGSRGVALRRAGCRGVRRGHASAP